jgi:hypothetical protein
MKLKRHHKWALAIAMLVCIAAWLAWTMLTVKSDMAG